jgi:hypothetical protein
VIYYLLVKIIAPRKTEGFVLRNKVGISKTGGKNLYARVAKLADALP